jgi:hypothetical protein
MRQSHSHIFLDNWLTGGGEVVRLSRRSASLYPQSLWCNSQSSWLQIQRFAFNCRRYKTFWEVVGLERGPLSLVSTIEELLGIKSSGSGSGIQEYGCRDPSRWPSGTLYPQKLALTSSTSGSRSIGIVLLRTQVTELSLTYKESFHHVLRACILAWSGKWNVILKKWFPMLFIRSSCC